MGFSGVLERWKGRARKLKVEAHALYLAYRDPRVPWYAKILVACLVAYIFSPIDLIPDFIPVLGYLDDLILVPLGIALVMKMVPQGVMEECREKARATMGRDRPRNWVAAAVIVSLWLLLALWAMMTLGKVLKGRA